MHSRILLALFIYLLTLPLLSAETLSMRRCILLPIVDTTEGAIGLKVFEEIEYYLKESNWCYYRSNSSLLSILEKYRSNLQTHLENSEVRQMVAQKSGAGSLLYLILSTKGPGSEIDFKILGSNGSDLLFSEKTRLESVDIKLIAQTVINWLEIYSKSIPYDGLVTGVLGDQISVGVNDGLGFSKGDEAKVMRPKNKKVHPLLKEVVDFETEPLAKGKLTAVDKEQTLAVMNRYYSKKPIVVGDWVIIEKAAIIEEEAKENPSNDEDFGKLGLLGFALTMGKGAITISEAGKSAKKMGGPLLGVEFNGELWFTREYFAKLFINRNFGSYSLKEGVMSVDSSTLTGGAYQVMGGYRFLPLKFFYGPRIEGTLGYSRYTFGVDSSPLDGLVAASISGPQFGLKGDMPATRLLRVFLDLDFMAFGKYTEDQTVYGKDKSVSHYRLGLGTTYEYNRATLIESSLNFSSTSAKFESPERAVKFDDTLLKLGLLFKY